ncbi:FHA domain protein [Gemmata obscuriglobus]|uniref:FHA domain-containing protein n=1 Tax=Gemmata obscuriglobus TaxID=114 RepID=UPI00016C50AF|nr:FHA domain-containing protein [Gemmata obscuriglobus]QEG31988.1 FHA domain protein [Gemmata obscuriglobus]VTS11338.1 fha domain-containing protein : FHA domain-containing protein OS=Singulisphaera acidiphila (strain ATCC BAA-1392 / DSM 18658 / VKM B-2454 / MOB10) GN=Sinac_5475 PE=4 SV=1: FHA: FHA [Gemmata obscuriglobus UQM 2246]
MSDPLIARFADACGALGPLKLRVDLVGGGVLAEGAVDQPFTLVGRDDACDVTLSDSDINPRHAWLQVLAGRVYVVDLGSRSGVVWPGGARGSGWLDHGTGAKLGPFSLRLGATSAPPPAGAPSGYNPLAADPNTLNRPLTTLEFRNGKRARDRWTVNRLLTLVGRSPECKIHLTADDISPYHCGLVLTVDGLWVVDLSGRGVVVNGERMRVAPLPHGAELWVGRFLIGCQTLPGPQPTPPPGARAARGTPPGARAAIEDEVELGAVPDLTADLPASHIMADAFRGAALGGPASNPILVSGGTGQHPAAGSNGSATELLDPTGDAAAAGLGALLRQMAVLHDRGADAFAQWLDLLPRLLAQVQPGHRPLMLHELGRIEGLTTEIAALQNEASRQVLERAAKHAADKAPTPTEPPLDRLRALYQERAERWTAVASLFTNG